MMEIWLVYSTFPHRAEALSAARALVESRLAACVNIDENVTSVYRWEGEIQEEKEVALSAKTTKENVAKTIAALKSLHSYQVPCIIAYPIAEGFPPFLQWIAEETA